MSYENHDPLVSDLPRAIAIEGHYKLRRVGDFLRIYMDYTDDDGVRRSMMVRDGIHHEEDFSSHVDDLEEEVRIMMMEEVG